MNPLTFNPWLVIGAGAVFLSIGGFGAYQYQRAEAWQAKTASVEVQLDNALTTNASNVTTINEQNKALNEWIKTGTTPDEVKALVKKMREVMGKYADTMIENAKLKEKDRANPDCDAILSRSFQRACPLIAGRLRNYETRDANGDGGDPGAGTGAAPRGTNRDMRAAVPLSER